MADREHPREEGCPRCRQLDEIVRLAMRLEHLDRQPRQPTGGMRSGDMVEVGLRDWQQHVRLARWIRLAFGGRTVTAQDS